MNPNGYLRLKMKKKVYLHNFFSSSFFPHHYNPYLCNNDESRLHDHHHDHQHHHENRYNQIDDQADSMIITDGAEKFSFGYFFLLLKSLIIIND